PSGTAPVWPVPVLRARAPRRRALPALDAIHEALVAVDEPPVLERPGVRRLQHGQSVDVPDLDAAHAAAVGESAQRRGPHRAGPGRRRRRARRRRDRPGTTAAGRPPRAARTAPPRARPRSTHAEWTRAPRAASAPGTRPRTRPRTPPPTPPRG